ncbi:hypothetical protein [Brucella pseudintermedia]|uniref:hypothetical protein n=1 Tax=Brucella pseudintermedia TaxID=370111 RepID=UPI0030F49031
MASETFADELRAAVAGDKFTLYTELMLQAAELLDHKDEQINTRPAPAATDTGLVRYDLSIFGNGIVEMGGGAYVRADQAEELLAAERDKVIVQTKRGELAELKERWLKEMVAAITSNPIGSPKHFRAVEDARRALNNPEASLYALYEKEELIQRVEKAEADNAALIHDLNRIKDHETELVNDNVAKDARIKELEEALDSDPVVQAKFETVADGIIGTRSVDVKRVEREDDDSLTVVIDYWPTPSPEVTALKAKNEQLRRALEPFAKISVSTVPEGRLGHVPDKHPYMVDLDGNVLFTASDIRKARAVLGGTPS